VLPLRVNKARNDFRLSIRTVLEIKNREGQPHAVSRFQVLPRGRVRRSLYVTDGVAHTPTDPRIKTPTGSAFVVHCGAGVDYAIVAPTSKINASRLDAGEDSSIPSRIANDWGLGTCGLTPGRSSALSGICPAPPHKSCHPPDMHQGLDGGGKRPPAPLSCRSGRIRFWKGFDDDGLSG